jgi:hypothetical protein
MSPKHYWHVCIGVPYGTHYGKLGIHWNRTEATKWQRQILSVRFLNHATMENGTRQMLSQ